ncbi:MAG: hypothetical protein ACLPLR_11115 [Terriglobales bacterium]
MSVRELRKAILERCDFVQAILAFNYRLTRETKAQLDLFRSRSLEAPAKELREMRDAIERQIEATSGDFGSILIKRKEFTALLIAGSRYGSGVVNLSKAVIDSQYFRNFCGGSVAWRSFSPHLRLAVNFDRVVPSRTDQIAFDYYLNEATLYEDMALAYNAAKEIEPAVTGTRSATADLDSKKHAMHMRTAVLSAFYFVEAYLNGIAFDFYYRNEQKLSMEEKEQLLEWNFGKNQRSFVSFERTILNYPKIIMRKKHPPLTTTNSKELKVLMGDAKEFRDSIVHQSPKTDDVLKTPEKVVWMMSLRMGHVTEVVDAAVGFVRELNALLGKEGIPLDWLCSRDQEAGTFPPESFN